jgi:hypothetical protein
MAAAERRDLGGEVESGLRIEKAYAKNALVVSKVNSPVEIKQTYSATYTVTSVLRRASKIGRSHLGAFAVFYAILDLTETVSTE